MQTPLNKEKPRNIFLDIRPWEPRHNYKVRMYGACYKLVLNRHSMSCYICPSLPNYENPN